MLLTAAMPSITTYAQEAFSCKGCYFREISGESVSLSEGERYVELTYDAVRHDKEEGTYSGNVVIPAEVEFNGVYYSVVAIGDEAFRFSNSISSIEYPSTIVSIGKAAYMGCTNVPLWPITDNGVEEYTDIPEKVNYIGDMAFMGSGVEKIYAKSNHIGEAAFKDCTKLKEVCFFYGSKSHIGTEAFANCTNLVYLQLYADVVGESAFAGCANLKGSRTSSDVPHCSVNANYVYENAFEGCSSLVNLYIAPSVRGVYDMAFKDCTALSYVAFEAYTYDDKFNGMPYTDLAVSTSIFSGCTALERASIGRRLISGNKSILVNPLIGRNIKNIYFTDFALEVAFNGLDFPNLEDVSCMTYIPPTGASFTDSQYKNVHLYTPRYTNSLYETAPVWKNFKQSGTTMAANIKIVEENGLYFVFNSQDKTMWLIRNPYGKYYSGKINIPKEVEFEGIKYPVVAIYDSAFYDCTGVESIELPASLKKLFPYAFAYSGISSIEFKNKITDFPDGVFCNCQNLKVVKNGAEDDALDYCSFGDMSFSGCKNLTSIQFPASGFYGEEAFSYCKSLGETLDFSPKSESDSYSYATFGKNAFYGCSIKNLILGETYLDGETPFYNNPLETIKVGYIDCDNFKLWGNDIGTGTLDNVVLTGYVKCNSYFTTKNWIAPGIKIKKLTIEFVPENLKQEYAYWLGSAWDVDEIKLYSPTPLIVSEFTEDQYKSVNLTVPNTAIDKYKEANIWKNFLNIKGVNINSVETIDSAIRCYAADGHIKISALTSNASYAIYKTSGICIANGSISYESIAINVDSGIYVVVVNGERYKIAI